MHRKIFNLSNHKFPLHVVLKCSNSSTSQFHIAEYIWCMHYLIILINRHTDDKASCVILCKCFQITETCIQSTYSSSRNRQYLKLIDLCMHAMSTTQKESQTIFILSIFLVEQLDETLQNHWTQKPEEWFC